MKKGILVWTIAAVLCILYGICVLATNSGTGFFLIWIFLGVICLFLALASKLGLWKKLPKRIRRICWILMSLGMFVFLLTEGFILSGFSAKGQKNLDYVIVLGAQVYENGPSAVLKYRLDAAYEYLENNPDTICIVSGGQGYNEPFPEAEGMKNYLVQKGIASERILEESTSRNTIENISNSMQFLDAANDSVGIVSNNFHVFRAVGIAKKQGIVHAEGVAADTHWFYLPNNMFREFFGVVKDTLKGNMVW